MVIGCEARETIDKGSGYSGVEIRPQGGRGNGREGQTYLVGVGFRSIMRTWTKEEVVVRALYTVGFGSACTTQSRLHVIITLKFCFNRSICPRAEQVPGRQNVTVSSCTDYYYYYCTD